jgi:hypothetical protein
MAEDYGARMLDMLAQALSSEEKQLQEFRERNIRGPDYADIRSVRMFDEKWIKYLVVKQALRDARPPRVETEVEGHQSRKPSRHRRDFLFLDCKGCDELAAFELTGPFYIGKNELGKNEPDEKSIEKIANDFRKLREAENLGATPRYVILLPYGREPDVKAWLQKIRVRDFLTGDAHDLSQWIQLNQVDYRGTDMLITLLEVAAR